MKTSNNGHLTLPRYGYIDALRGIAILGVIAVHTGQRGTFDVPGIFKAIVDQGSRGVQLFFITSAFTLFLSLKKRVKEESFLIKNFFIRRFFRIAPLFYIAICYYALQTKYGDSAIENHVSGLTVIANTLFIHGINPYWINSIVPGGWSISIEMTFYLILPYIFYKIENINQAMVFLNITLIIKSCFYLIFSSWNPIQESEIWRDYLFFYLPNQLPIFAMGIIMYFLLIEKKNIFKDVFKGTLFLFITCLLVQLVKQEITHGILLILSGLALTIFSIILGKEKPNLFINPIIVNIGKISFSMYLVHFSVLYWLTELRLVDYLKNGILNYLLRLIIVITITVIISLISYNLVELPFQKIGRKLIDRNEDRNEDKNE